MFFFQTNLITYFVYMYQYNAYQLDYSMLSVIIAATTINAHQVENKYKFAVNTSCVRRFFQGCRARDYRIKQIVPVFNSRMNGKQNSHIARPE